MTIYKLIELHEKNNKGSHFFDNDTLKFFGESLRTMTVLKQKVIIEDYIGNKHNCFVVSCLRRKNAFGSCKPYRYYHYFDDEKFYAVIR